MDENKQEQMVSIIAPVYNAEAYLPEMIESVIFQNYNNWELLLIDNCSMDNSFEICQSYEKKDVRIRVIQETLYSHRGQSEIMVCWLPTVAI